MLQNSVFIAFFKLEAPNRNYVIENEPIYLRTKFPNNQPLCTHLVYIYFQLFKLFFCMF
jgi:hypothetical protein